MLNFKLDTKNMTILGMLTAVVIIFSITPIGSIPINPQLSVSLNMIPVAIAAVALGPIGGAIIGAVFGLFSFFQTIGIGIPSQMGIVLTNINPFLSFMQRFVPRVLDGFLVGLLFRAIAKRVNVEVACPIAGFCAALFNTLLFMSALVLLFGKTDYMVEKMGGKGFLAYVLGAVAGNAVFEMIASTVITGAVGIALYKAKLIKLPNTDKAADKK